MKNGHDIVSQVYKAKEDVRAADELVREYLPFIKAETAKIINKVPVEGHDYELSIAMFAFHEAIMSYSDKKGAFLKLAKTVIRNRLIDYHRREKRHSGSISLYQTVENDENNSTLLEKVDSGKDEISDRHEREAAKKEIADFSRQLSEFGLKLTDVADNCPKQKRTMSACHEALAFAKKNPLLLEELVASRKLPIGALTKGTGVARKTLERHRKYLVALLLAFTNGFEIIRGHLRQIMPKEGR